MNVLSAVIKSNKFKIGELFQYFPNFVLNIPLIIFYDTGRDDLHYKVIHR